MSEKIIQLNEGVIKNELKELVRNSVEGTLNGLLEAEANQLTILPNMSVVRNARATAAATIAEISPQSPATSRCKFPS